MAEHKNLKIGYTDLSGNFITIDPVSNVSITPSNYGSTLTVSVNSNDLCAADRSTCYYESYVNKGNFDIVKDSDVQYEFESPNQFFGLTQTMIPMANAVAAARNFYGHKFQTQAVPLTYGEAPLTFLSTIQNGSYDGVV